MSSSSNTKILIKRSSLLDKPSSLLGGELAYSYSSNVFFIGTENGATLNVGGVYYTTQIDNSTSTNTASTLVRRDSNNGFYGALYGNANTATKLLDGRNFSIDGLDVESSAVGFDGTGAVVLQGNLKTTGVTSGTYGGQTEIPVITVDSKGRISYAANVSVATTLDIGADNGSNTVDLLTQTLQITGGVGITSTVVDQTITLDVDNTVVRSNTASMNQTIDGDITISGNLFVQGTQTIVDSNTVSVSDPLLLLAKDNTTDVWDIGTVGQYSPDGGDTILRTGIFRHAGDQQYYVFDGYTGDVTANTVNPADGSFNLATLHANLTAPTANITTVSLDGTAATITTSDSNVVLTPDNGTSALAGVQIAGNGYILGPDGSRNMALNYGSESGRAGLYRAQVYNDQESTNTTSGALIVSGGLGLAKNLNVGGNTAITGTLSAGLVADNTPTNIVYFNDSTGELSYGDSSVLNPHQISNGAYSMWISDTDGQVTAPGKILAAQSTGTSNGGFSFSGTEGGHDTGMFSATDGILDFYSNNVLSTRITDQQTDIYTNNSLMVSIGTGGLTTYNKITLANGSIVDDATNGSLAFGYRAGYDGSGDNAIMIGAYAGYSSGAAHSIVLNASGSDLSSATEGLFINPVRYTGTQDATYDGLMFYNSSTKEVRYSYTLDGGSF